MKRIFYILGVGFTFGNVGFAEDSSNSISQTQEPIETTKKTDKKFFSFGGVLASFTKAGFNNAPINTTTGQYPTDSFSTIFGQFNTKYDFLAFMSSNNIAAFEIGLGVSAAGLTWDSTKFDGQGMSFSGITTGSGLNNNYVGAYFGPTKAGTDASGRYINNRYFMVQNAYINLVTDSTTRGGTNYGFRIKAGRYQSEMDYHTGYVQGFNVDFHFGYGDKSINPNNDIKIWWFSSYGRAFSYSQWFIDFYFPKSSRINGKDINLGIHSAGIDINYGGFHDINGYKKGHNLLVRPFFWFYPGLYEAPGAKLVYENHFGNGYGLKATAQGFFLHVQPISSRHANAAGNPKGRYDQAVDEYSGNLNIILQAFMFNYNARIGYYQNFGSANSHFATYGNPMGLDYWTTSVYDIGPSISDIVSRNSASVYLSCGGFYDLKYGKFSWDILARLTRSPRSDEESIALTVKHAFKNNLSVEVKLEYLRDTTKAGFNPGASLTGTSTLSSNRTDDRSHAFIDLTYSF